MDTAPIQPYVTCGDDEGSCGEVLPTQAGSSLGVGCDRDRCVVVPAERWVSWAARRCGRASCTGCATGHVLEPEPGCALRASTAIGLLLGYALCLDVKVVPVETGRLNVGLLVHEHDQQSQRIAVRGDGARAEPALFGQPVGEEAMQGGMACGSCRDDGDPASAASSSR